MALRVLLADESSTIKKVIQLALQDYAVQVRSVSVGSEALEVAQQFEPDLVLADVLLPKKNGYEVCAEIRANSVLKNTPVILMWSGFMEIDEKQFSSSQASDRIEKPFNVETLRALVQKWVPKTKEQTLSQFLHFPTTITEMEADPARVKGQGEVTTRLDPVPSLGDLVDPDEITADVVIGAQPPDLPNLDDEKTADWDMDSFEDINAFVSTEHLIQKTTAKAEPEAVKPRQGPTLVKMDPPGPAGATANKSGVAPVSSATAASKNTAAPKNDLGVDIDALNQEPVDLSLILSRQDALAKPVSSLDPAQASSVPRGGPTGAGSSNRATSNLASSAAANVAAVPPIPTPQIPQLSAEQLEQLVRAQSRDIIEAVVWKIVPEMAGQMIRDQLERLMAEE